MLVHGAISQAVAAWGDKSPVHQDVQDAFYMYNAPFEGVVYTMYADIKGLVTIGVGNLIDPLPIGLPMFRADGTAATYEEIEDEYFRVKRDPLCATKGWTYARKLCKLRMTDDGVRTLVATKAAQMAAYLASRFPAFSSWPADAQLGLLSLAWAVGPAFKWPKLQQALLDRDWEACIVHAQINSKGNPGVIPRNNAQRTLFANAMWVERKSMPHETLYYPDAIG